MKPAPLARPFVVNFVTFGQAHEHRILNQFFNKDCVAIYTSSLVAEGRDLAFKLFGPKFCFHYASTSSNKIPEGIKMSYYPRGLIPIPPHSLELAKHNSVSDEVKLAHTEVSLSGNSTTGQDFTTGS